MREAIKKSAMSILLATILVIAIVPQMKIKANAASGVEDFVRRCYKVSFQREADQGGLNYWVGEIEGKKRTGVDVVYNFIFSKEYESQKTSDKQFVKDLYTMFMGREPDQGGYDYWCGQLAEGKERKDIFTGFANSLEFYKTCNSYGITSGYYTDEIPLNQLSQINLFVARMYETTLGRVGDPEGQKYWVEGLAKGDLTGIGCAVNFIKSNEFESQQLSQEEYLDRCYEAFMGREADEAGKQYWLDQMKSGEKSRDQVFEGFAKSNEFQTICKDYNIESGDYTATIKDDKHKYDDIPSKEEKPVVREERINDAFGGGYSIKKYENDVLVSWVNYYSNGDKYYDTEIKDGVVVKTTYYEHSGEVDYYQTHTYFSNGLIKQIIKYDTSNRVTSKLDFFENGANGVKKETYITKSGKIASTRTYTYDANGRCLTDKSYDGDEEKPTAWTLNEYYSNGQIKKVTYLMCGILQNIYEYDSTGTLIRFTDNTRMNDIFKTVSEYYSNKGLKKRTHLDKSDNVVYVEEYDEEGYLKVTPNQELIYEESGCFSVKKYNKGLLISWIGYCNSGRKDYEYEINSLGKITKKNYYDEFSDNPAIVRVIEYNEDEREVKDSLYDTDGNSRGYITYEYENGKLKYQKIHNIDDTLYSLTEYYDNESVKKEIIYDHDVEMYYKEYNTAGSETLNIIYEHGIIRYKLVTSYYDNNNKKEETHFCGDVLDYKIEYNESGYKVTWTVYSISSDSSIYTIYEYSGTSQENLLFTYVYENNKLTLKSDHYENGNPKTRTYYDSLGNVIEIDECNEDGNTVKMTCYYEDGTIKSVTDYYDNGNRKKSVSYYADEVMEYESFYNENGVLINEKIYSPTGKITIVNDYTEDGVSKKRTYYEEAGYISSVLNFDDNGNQAEEIYYDEMGDIECTFVFECYESGEIKKTTKFNYAGKIVSVSEYYENGNLKISIQYDSDGNVTAFYEYDEDGILIE